MPPRKKQRTDDAGSSVADPQVQPEDSQPERAGPAPRRMLTRAAAKGLNQPPQAGGSKTRSRTTRSTKTAAATKASTAKARTTTKASKAQAPTETKTSKAKAPLATKASKAPATSNAVRTHRKGRLQTLPDLPVEIQLEIYSYLESRDLLLLSRLCKKFHAFFLTRSLTKSLWVQARLNTDGIPPCPPFMSEPAFVNLLYSPYCQLCGCSNVRPMWKWFLRCCVKCMQDSSLNPAEAYRYSYEHSKRNIPLSTIHGVLEFCQRVLPVINPSRKHIQSRVHNRIPTAEFERVVKEWNGQKDKAAVDKSLYKQWDAWDAFVDAQAARQQERNELARQCAAWHARQEDGRYNALEVTREARFNDILKRLKEDGWEKDLEFMGPDAVEELSEMPVIRQAAKLTPKGWLAVRERLDDVLNDTRRRRLEKEREDVVRQRCHALESAIRDHYGSLPRTADMEARPHYIDFAYSEECRALLDAPGSDEVAPAAFAQLVPSLTAQWESKQKKALAAAVKRVLPFALPEGVDVLALAVAVFPCQCAPRSSTWESMLDTTHPVHWPAILGHWCMREPRFSTTKLPPADAYERSVMRAWTDTGRELEDETQWRVPFDVKAFTAYLAKGPIRQACYVLEALGLDPARATLEDMRRCENVRLRCLVCVQPNPYRHGVVLPDKYEAHTCMGAIRHAIMRSGWREELQHRRWEVIEEEHMPVIQEMESQADAQALVNAKDERDHATWCCSLCVDYNGTREPMVAHLRTVHGIEDTTRCVQDGIIFVHPTLPSKQYTIKPAVLLPVSSTTATTWTPPDALKLRANGIRA